MNLQSTKIAKTFIKSCLFFTVFFVNVSVRAWEIDMSRRQKDLNKRRSPASLDPAQSLQSGPLVFEKKDAPPTVNTESLFDALGPTQELVILNTENGFVPETLHLKKGGNYKINVVNVNEKEKNISFLLDAFSEHHATYFGQRKTFTLTPKIEGVYSFICPETSKQGRLVIYSDAKDRAPAVSE